MRSLFALFFFFLLSIGLSGQAPKKISSADIYDAIQRAQFLGSVMYIAAHPDDENTRMISYFSNHVKANTTYLSLTRGDGGQNVLGTELRELLGMLRTQELLMARGIDNGNQMFSRANDFGYSKSSEETLATWNRDEVLNDVVWAIRKIQPDIIINRFSHDTSRRTHGHHTSSAILSYEAFDLASDPFSYPRHMNYYSTWQPKRLFFNTSWWFYGSRENFEKADKSDMISVDGGVYYPSMGKSNNEIAAESRSMHKCQSMGSTPSRGSEPEYLQLLKGEKITNSNDPFEGINTSWSRLQGGAKVGTLLRQVEKDFDFSNPAASVPELMNVLAMIQNLRQSRWRDLKAKEVKDIIVNSMALFIEATANTNMAVKGETVDITFELTNRSNQEAQLLFLRILPMGLDSTFQMNLDNNQRNRFELSITIPEYIKYTNAYWLNEKGSYGMYKVASQKLRGLPETPRELKVQFSFLVDGKLLEIEKNIVFKKTDRIAGEVYQPFEIVPPVSSNIQNSVYVFADNAPKEVEVIVKSSAKSAEGEVFLNVPDGWRTDPVSHNFSMSQRGEELSFKFLLYPSEKQEEVTITSSVKIGGEVFSKSLFEINYDHIPLQLVYQPSTSKAVKIDLKRQGQRIGYIMGAGDDIPNSLEQIGYSVELLDDTKIRADYLQSYDAVILGIRAFNTVDKLKFLNKELMEYVKKGGNVIVQYNWTRGLVTNDLGPYPLQLSRDRVSMEDAEVRILIPDHEALNSPNKITSSDFNGWVQERGLYFANEWDQNYQALLSSNDPGETPKEGGLLIAKYGDGYYINTGYSWFRQLPAGVPGAFRLFTNLISLGNTIRP
jgi:LmbE family N-acetylglucosaminyl deacetylase